jgi:hypothetical protein
VSWKTAAAGKVSHFADNFMGGSHDLKLGVQFDSGGSDYAYGLNDYIYTYGSTVAYGYTQLPWHQGGQKKSLGTFVDDTYRIGSHVTLNLGIRYDWSRASIRSYPVLDAKGAETSQKSPAIGNVFTWNSVSPRFGMVFKLNQAGTSMVKAHAGRYYGGVITGEFDNVSPSVTPRYLFDGTYRNGVPNPASLERVSDNTSIRVDSGFKNPHTDQYILGFEQELARNLGLQVSYVHKRGEDYGGWQETAGRYTTVSLADDRGVGSTGQILQVQRLLSDPGDRLFVLTNPAQMHSRYNGLSIQAQKKMSSRWQMTGSIVFSKAEGLLGSNRPTTSSSTPTPISNPNATAGTFGQNPNDFVNADGRLIGDRPVVGKLQLLYEAPGNVLFGLNFTHQDGRLYGRQARITGLGIPTTVWAEPLDGRRRVAAWNTFDLRVQKDFPVGTAKLGVFGDILNLTNIDANESVGSQNGAATNFAVPTRFLYPRRLMLGAKIRF